MKYTKLSEDVEKLLNIKADDCIYRSVTLKIDSIGNKRSHAIMFRGITNKNYFLDKTLIIELIDPREHIGTICYAVFPKEKMKNVVEVANKDENQSWFEIYKILPMCRDYVSKYSPLSMKLAIRTTQMLSKFEPEGNIIKYTGHVV